MRDFVSEANKTTAWRGVSILRELAKNSDDWLEKDARCFHIPHWNSTVAAQPFWCTPKIAFCCCCCCCLFMVYIIVYSSPKQQFKTARHKGEILRIYFIIAILFILHYIVTVFIQYVFFVFIWNCCVMFFSTSIIFKSEMTFRYPQISLISNKKFDWYRDIYRQKKNYD